MAQLMDWYSSNFGLAAGTTSGASLLSQGIGGGFAYQQAALQNQYATYNPYYNTITISTTDSMGAMTATTYDAYMKLVEKVSGKAQEVKKKIHKTGKILLDLRREIDDWHGDVLMKAA